MSPGEPTAGSTAPWLLEKLVVLNQALQLVSECPGKNCLLPLDATDRCEKLHAHCSNSTNVAHKSMKISDIEFLFTGHMTTFPLKCWLTWSKERVKTAPDSSPSLWLQHLKRPLTSQQKHHWYEKSCCPTSRKFFSCSFSIIINVYPSLRQRTVYNMTWRLPITLPLNEIKSLTPFDEVIDKVHYVFAKAIAGNCS